MIKDMDSFIERGALGDGRSPGVTHWASFISTTPPRFTLGYNPNAPRPRFSETMLSARPTRRSCPSIMKRLEHYVTERYPDIRPYVRPLGNGPPVAKPIEVRISGKDVDRTFEIADTVKQWLNDRDDTRNVGDNWGPRVKKMVDRGQRRPRPPRGHHQRRRRDLAADLPERLRDHASTAKTTKPSRSF